MFISSKSWWSGCAACWSLAFASCSKFPWQRLGIELKIEGRFLELLYIFTTILINTWKQISEINGLILTLKCNFEVKTMELLVIFYLSFFLRLLFSGSIFIVLLVSLDLSQTKPIHFQQTLKNVHVNFVKYFLNADQMMK